LYRVHLYANIINIKRIIEFYITETGRCPVSEFLDSLPDKVFQKIAWVLRLISELDQIPSQFFKKLPGTDDIWECRIEYSSNNYRLLGFFYNGSLIIFTHGFLKKTKRTPKKEIERAEECKQNYFRRKMQ